MLRFGHGRPRIVKTLRGWGWRASRVWFLGGYMRVWSRNALVVVLLLWCASPLLADPFVADCPLSLSGAIPGMTDFETSPHGVFRFGNLIYTLRGQVLTTLSPDDVGQMMVVREDFLGTLAGRQSAGAAGFSNGFLYMSSEAGLEVFDLRNTRAGGTAPALVSRTPGLFYRRLAVNGTRMAGLYPATELPCYPANTCTNTIDVFSITTPSAPARVAQISSSSNSLYRGFNDVAFNRGYLLAVSEVALVAFDLTNPALPVRVASATGKGKWLVSDGDDLVGVGNDRTIEIYAVRPGMSPFFLKTKYLTIPDYVAIDRGNQIRFSSSAWYDDTNARLFTMIEEIDPMTLDAARTIAFDVFDFTVPQIEGSVERIYEDVTFINDNEIKYNPVVVGQYVYVIGELTGVQSWGACGIVAGRIELDSPNLLTCNGAEIHGWVTGTQRITDVELFLGSESLGFARIFGERTDISSSTPVMTWRVNVNLDDRARGLYELRAVGTDSLNNTRQFAAMPLFLAGPGQNCTVPRRRAVR